MIGVIQEPENRISQYEWIVLLKEMMFILLNTEMIDH